MTRAPGIAAGYRLSVRDARARWDGVPGRITLHHIAAFLKSPSLRQGTIVLVDQGIASLSTFLTGVLVARACAANMSEFGRYVFGMTLVITVLGFQRGLISLPYTVLRPHLERHRRAAYLGSTIVHHVLAGLLACVVLALLGTLGGTWSGLGGSTPIWFPLSLAIAGRLTHDFVRVILLADLRVRACLVVGLISNALMLAMLGWEYANDRLCVSRAYLVLAACWGGPAVVTLMLMRREIRLSVGDIGPDFASSFRLGKWMTATDTTFLLSRQMIPWVLAATWGTAGLAALGVCEGVSGVIGYASRGMSAFFLPKLSHAARSPERMRTVVIRSLTLLSPLSVACLLVMWLAGDWLLVTLYSSCYRGLRGPLMACCLGASLGLVSVPVNQAIHALQRSDMGFRALLYSLPLSMCLGSVLTWRFGVWGACLSTCLGIAGAFAHRAFFLFRHLSGGACTEEGFMGGRQESCPLPPPLDPAGGVS